MTNPRIRLTKPSHSMSSSRWTDIKDKRRNSPWVAVPVSIQTKWKSQFSWGLDPDDRPMLLFETRQKINLSLRLPSFSGVQCTQFENGGKTTLVFRLQDQSLLDIYDQFIDYLVTSAESEASEENVHPRLINRAWRWHYLLKYGGSRLLSLEEQKGLLAELYVLHEIMAPNIGVASAIEAWTGPSDAPKDFETSSLCIEVKARRSSAVDAVQVSSSDQLADSFGHALLLIVVNVERSSSDDINAKNFNEWVDSVRAFIVNLGPEQVSRFDELLCQVGYVPTDNYSEFSYTLDGFRVFEVRHGFPRITPASHSTDIDLVKYRLKLQDLDDYLIPHEELSDYLKS